MGGCLPKPQHTHHGAAGGVVAKVRRQAAPQRVPRAQDGVPCEGEVLRRGGPEGRRVRRARPAARPHHGEHERIPSALNTKPQQPEALSSPSHSLTPPPSSRGVSSLSVPSLSPHPSPTLSAGCPDEERRCRRPGVREASATSPTAPHASSSTRDGGGGARGGRRSLSDDALGGTMSAEQGGLPAVTVGAHAQNRQREVHGPQQQRQEERRPLLLSTSVGPAAPAEANTTGGETNSMVEVGEDRLGSRPRATPATVVPAAAAAEAPALAFVEPTTGATLPIGGDPETSVVAAPDSDAHAVERAMDNDGHVVCPPSGVDDTTGGEPLSGERLDPVSCRGDGGDGRVAEVQRRDLATARHNGDDYPRSAAHCEYLPRQPETAPGRAEWHSGLEAGSICETHTQQTSAADVALMAAPTAAASIPRSRLSLGERDRVDGDRTRAADTPTPTPTPPQTQAQTPEDGSVPMRERPPVGPRGTPSMDYIQPMVSVDGGLRRSLAAMGSRDSVCSLLSTRTVPHRLMTGGTNERLRTTTAATQSARAIPTAAYRQHGSGSRGGLRGTDSAAGAARTAPHTGARGRPRAHGHDGSRGGPPAAQASAAALAREQRRQQQRRALEDRKNGGMSAPKRNLRGRYDDPRRAPEYLNGSAVFFFANYAGGLGDRDRYNDELDAGGHGGGGLEGGGFGDTFFMGI